MANQGLSNGHHKLASAPGLASQTGLAGNAGLNKSVRAPVLDPVNIHISLPVGSGHNIGYVPNRSDFADTFNIVLASPPAALNFFAVDDEGELTITSAGASGLTARTYFLLVDAVNDGGFGNAVVMIVAA